MAILKYDAGLLADLTFSVAYQWNNHNEITGHSSKSSQGAFFLLKSAFIDLGLQPFISKRVRSFITKVNILNNLYILIYRMTPNSVECSTVEIVYRSAI